MERKRDTMSQTVPDVIPDDIMEIGISELTVEEILGEDQTPCEVQGHFFGECQSNGELPATWLTSHLNAKPSCTVLVCEPCVVHLQQWVAKCVVMNGAHGFGCRKCGLQGMHYTELITRQL